MSDINLSLGSGNTRLKGYLNVDIVDRGNTDVKHDLNKPLPYNNGEVSNIYTSHVIEHLWWKDSFKIIKDWYRVLKKGGSLVIWTVDFEKVIDKLSSDGDYVQIMIDINWRIFSRKEPEDRYNSHHSIFTKKYLQFLLEGAGFKRVGIINPDEYEFKPLHNGINMGLMAIK